MKRSLLLLIVPLLFTFVSVPVQAAIFLKLEGIQGDAQADDHKDEIELSSWGWGVIADAKSVQCPQSVDVTKTFDRSSMKLAEKAALATPIERAAIFLTRQTSKAGSFDYVRLELESVQLRDYSITQDGDGGLPTESFTIDFRKIVVMQMEEDARSSGGTVSPKEVHSFTLDVEQLGDCGPY